MTSAPNTTPPCPACKGESFRRLFEKKGRTFWRCTSCGLQRQYPLPTLDELRAYYDQSYASGLYREFVDADEMKVMTAKVRLQAVRDACRPGRWLDVGCANGIFVNEARQAGFDAEGIDLSDVAVQRGVDAGLPLVCGTVDAHHPGYRYDTVTGFDVLEHVLEPAAFLAQLRDQLVDGGTVAISVPNLGSWSRRLMGRRWYFYIPEEHMHYFDRRSLARLMRTAGLEPVRCRTATKPMTWDYALTQFDEYNPLIYRAMKLAGTIVPAGWRARPIPLPIGEMTMIARR